MSSRKYYCRLECKVFVGNLSASANRHELEAVFRRFGRVNDVWIATNPPGFAFVMFEHSSDAKSAVRALNDTRICGRTVTVEMSTGRTRHDRSDRYDSLSYHRSRDNRSYAGYAHYRNRHYGNNCDHRRDYYNRRKSRSKSRTRSPFSKRYDKSMKYRENSPKYEDYEQKNDKNFDIKN